MAQRRMFSKAIVNSEEFSVMPKSSQALYFHLGMEADDDGFIHPGKIMRSGGFQSDDLKILLAKRFLLTFESGVVVIKHWLIHNLIQKDRHTQTRYQDELDTLFIKENKAYTDNTPIKLADVNKVLPQVRLGKVSKDNNAPPEGDIIENLLSEKNPIKYDYQYLGLEIFEKLDAPKEKKSECIRLAKMYPKLINPSLSFASDYPNPKLKWKMFLWKLNDLRKNETHKQTA